MKKILVVILLLSSVLAFSQEKETEYDFRVVKTYTDKSERIAYFKIIDIVDQIHIDKIVDVLDNDTNIKSSSIIESRNGGYRCRVTTELGVNASYVIDLLTPLNANIDSKDIIQIENK